MARPGALLAHRGLAFRLVAVLYYDIFMTDSALLLAILVIIYSILFLHLLATAHYLYWLWWWYDILVHFLGGFWITLLIFWLCRHSRYLKKKLSFRVSAFLALISALIVGLAWEYFEYVVGFGPGEFGYVSDTVTDLIFDLIGAASAILVYYLAGRFFYKNHV